MVMATHRGFTHVAHISVGRFFFFGTPFVCRRIWTAVSSGDSETGTDEDTVSTDDFFFR